MDRTLIQSTCSKEFFKPLNEIFSQSSARRDCPGLSDSEFAELGIARVIDEARSGHGFLQHHADLEGRPVPSSTFFDALSSERRHLNLLSINDLMGRVMARDIQDPFAGHAELDDWSIFAGDGHYHKGALFDDKVISRSKPDAAPCKLAVGHFFRLNMRTHHMSYIDLGAHSELNKKEHDMSVLKRIKPSALRGGAPNGTRVLIAWDKAIIDYGFWKNLKRSGVYFVTMEKSGSSWVKCEEKTIDAGDCRNSGVIRDQIVSPDAKTKFRRITYRDPRDEKEYVFITNVIDLPAGLLVLVYKHRWDIEKIFHQFKSKFNERVAWGSSDEAKKNQAIFLCLGHNLALLMETRMISEENLSDEVEERRRKGRRKNQPTTTNFVNDAFERATQRTFRFIRWLRNMLYMKYSWGVLVEKLRDRWTKAI